MLCVFHDSWVGEITEVLSIEDYHLKDIGRPISSLGSLPPLTNEDISLPGILLDQLLLSNIVPCGNGGQTLSFSQEEGWLDSATAAAGEL